MPSNRYICAVFDYFLFTLLLMGYRPSDFEAISYTRGQKRGGNTHLKIQVKADLTGKLLSIISNTPSKSTLTPMLW